jgi:hypothetical protein
VIDAGRIEPVDTFTTEAALGAYLGGEVADRNQEVDQVEPRV